MIRLIILVLLGYLAYRFVRSLVAPSGNAPADRIRDNSMQHTEQADLVRDPQCGIYFLKSRAVRASMNGETLYFCSPACREAFLAANRPR